MNLLHRFLSFGTRAASRFTSRALCRTFPATLSVHLLHRLRVISAHITPIIPVTGPFTLDVIMSAFCPPGDVISFRRSRIQDWTGIRALLLDVHPYISTAGFREVPSVVYSKH